jgi:hypothetical protein
MIIINIVFRAIHVYLLMFTVSPFTYFIIRSNLFNQLNPSSNTSLKHQFKTTMDKKSFKIKIKIIRLIS